MRLLKPLLMIAVCLMLTNTGAIWASDPVSKAADAAMGGAQDKAMDMAKDKAMEGVQDQATDMVKDQATDMAKDQAMDAATGGMDSKIPSVDSAKPEVPSIPGTDDVTDMAKDKAMDAAKEQGDKMMKDAAEDQVKKLAQ